MMQHNINIEPNGWKNSCIFMGKSTMSVKDMTGEIYANLKVISYAGSKNGNARWNCECLLCGNTTIVTRPNLRSGNTVDCGCQRSKKLSDQLKKHGKCKTPTWNSWSRMHRRIKQGAEHSPIYGTISIDPSWYSFEQFYADMGERPTGCTIDRIDNTKGYSKENCRWATQAEQNRNRSTNVIIEHNGERLCITDWAKKTGLNRDTIRRRLDKGLTPAQVLAKQ